MTDYDEEEPAGDTVTPAEAPTARAITPIPRAKPTRDLPHSQEAEEHVLACCLLDEGATLDRAQQEGLTGNSFYLQAARAIFTLLCDLRHEGKPVSMEVLAEELMTKGQLQAVGGIPYLMQVTGKVPTTAHASYFIAQVREKHVLREFIKAGTGMVERAYNFTGGLEDYTAAARRGVEQAAKGASADILEGRTYDHTKPVPEPAPIFRTKDTVISTPGNMTALYSEAKVGKSAVIGAFIAATFVPPGAVNDTLGIIGANPEGHAVIHVDTELSRYHWQQGIQTACRRAGLDHPPTFFQSVTLTGLPAADVRRILRPLLAKAAERHKKVRALFLDGVADAVMNVNDPEECFPLITELHGLAIEFDCAIILVLHMNPRSDNTKGRGHLGSQLERKAESNLTLERDGENTLLYAIAQRGKAITKANALTFRWSDEAGMHVSTAGQPPVKLGAPRRYDPNLMIQCVPAPTAKPVPLNQIHRLIGELPCGISIRAFKDVMSTWVETGEVERVTDSAIGYGFRRKY